MSIHAKLSPEARILLRKQERKSRVLSAIIACLGILLVAGVLALFAIPMMIVDTATIVTYSAQPNEDREIQQRKVVKQTSRKPAAPAQNMAKVIAANTSAPAAIPVPDIMPVEPSLDFGDDYDFGQGWGDDGFEAGGSASFFGQQVKANRIAYVIDYSQSMKGERERIMREELAKSVSELPSGMLYQLIFFSGPVWVAGDKVEQRGMKATVISGKDRFEWESKGDHHAWDVVGKKLQTPAWRDVGISNIEESLKHIKETRLTSGTVWMPSMQMALRMEPVPQIIYFMTDGIAGPNSDTIAREIASLAREKGVIVNTIALMEPKARNAMITLAHETGGEAALVDAKGLRHVLEKK
ncbi:MAG: vWA domain-containing protein [Luteolibacter sp.]